MAFARKRELGATAPITLGLRKYSVENATRLLSDAFLYRFLFGRDMNKKIAIPCGILAVLLITIAFWAFWIPPATAAILYVEEGTVEADTGSGWVAATDEMELEEGAKVRTGAGTASIVLLEGEVMHLEPNSEIALRELGSSRIRISQVLGETWHKVTRISGVSAYEVETPSTVATVRGTEFFVTMDGEDEVAVEEGEVETGFVKSPSKKLMLTAKRKARMMSTEDIIDSEMSDDPRPAKFKQMYLERLQRMRMREIEKNGALLSMARKTYGVTDESLQQYLDDVDNGRRDEDEAYAQVPSALKKKIERAYQLTKAIKKAKRALQ
jgi:hypothetical protein